MSNIVVCPLCFYSLEHDYINSNFQNDVCKICGRLYIPLPEARDREILLRTLLAKNSNSLNTKEINRLANDTDGFSGADLKALCTDAALGPIRQLGARALMVELKDVPPISFKHFRQALKSMNPSVAKEDLEVYLQWNATYGSNSLTEENDATESEEE